MSHSNPTLQDRDKREEERVQFLKWKVQPVTDTEFLLVSLCPCKKNLSLEFSFKFTGGRKIVQPPHTHYNQLGSLLNPSLTRDTIQDLNS